MNPRFLPLLRPKLLANLIAALLAAGSLDAAAQLATAPAAETPSTRTLDNVLITAPRENDEPGAARVGDRELAAQRNATSDSAQLLQDIPGVSLYGAGNISSLPAIHGLADDRLRIQVDGMDLMPACPNHMNSTLSYINPSRVGSITAFAGITPVSAGGDSIGGSIRVESPAPEFARPGDGILSTGELAGFSRSNGHATGYNLSATLAGETASLNYAESHAQAGNYKAGADFKPAAKWSGAMQNGLYRTAPDEVASSSLRDSINRELGLALRHDGHLLRLTLAEQRVGFEGFPNQRMDMTDNHNTLANLRYTGQFAWGSLEARAFRQDTRHQMEMSYERVYAMPAMPMETTARTSGAALGASIDLDARHTLKVGSEYLTYRLNDWWPPVGDSPGSMCCNDFWNVRNGKRDRLGLYGEWEARWTPQWLTLLGMRSDTVSSDAGAAQGYSNAAYKTDADRFNARDHRRTDHNTDLTALARFVPDARQTYELGIARKSRSPNLYERYPWSTFAMAALMNNFVGDGNGYIGNPDLKPEVARTLSGTADWHGAEPGQWGLKATAYLTYVDDFIDAQRKPASTSTNRYLLLQYVNQSARLYGLDLSGHWRLARSDDFGSLTASGLLNYVRGENRTTGDNLYHIMPLNAKLALTHRLAAWTSTAEVQWVDAKNDISQVRNEIRTEDYTLFNLRSSYTWKHARLDLALENVFNKFYSLPLGGAYVGQGASMTTGIIPWGYSIPGMGRSFNVALNLHF